MRRSRHAAGAPSAPGSAGRVLHGLLMVGLVIGFLVVALLAFLVAWWIALLIAGTWLLVTGVRRLFQSGHQKPAARASATIIEGEYRVERHSGRQETLSVVASDKVPPKD